MSLTDSETCEHGQSVYSCSTCDAELDAALNALEAETVPPHYHACRPYGRARKHCNDFPCWDEQANEKQHEGYGLPCGSCEQELRESIPDDGHDDPRYGGY